LDPTSDSFFLKVAFVPTDGYFQQRYEDLKLDCFDALNIDDYTGFLGDMEGVSPESTSLTSQVNLYGVGSVNATFMDTSIYEDHKSWIYTVIRGFFAVFAYIYNINQVYKFLNRGASLVSAGFHSDRVAERSK
jgi:hypothetical protein